MGERSKGKTQRGGGLTHNKLGAYTTQRRWSTTPDRSVSGGSAQGPSGLADRLSAMALNIYCLRSRHVTLAELLPKASRTAAQQDAGLIVKEGSQRRVLLYIVCKRAAGG